MRSAAFAATAVLVLAACGGEKKDNGGTAQTGSPTPTANANAITIEEKEYAYLVSGELTAGWTTLDVKNTGSEYHMMAMGRLKQGKTLQEVTTALTALFTGQPPGGAPSASAEATSSTVVSPSMSPAAFGAPLQESPSATPSETASPTSSPGGDDEGDPFAEFFEEEIGAPGNILAPGQAAKVTVDFLKPGTYAMLCFIPTAGEGTPHIAKGMAGQFVVKDGNAGTEPQATHTAEVRKDTPPALTGLKAGETTVKVTNAGSEDHEFAAVRAKTDATTQKEIDDYFTTLFEGDSPPPKDVSGAPGRIDAYVFDFPAGETVYITMTLEAGTYFMGCGYEPDDGGEGHAEKEYAKVQVT